MKNCFLSFLTALLAFHASAQQFNISGKFKGYTGKIYLHFNGKKDSAEVKNEQFVFNGSIRTVTPAQFQIVLNKPSVLSKFILETGRLTIEVDTVSQILNNEPICILNSEVTEGGPINLTIADFQRKLTRNLAHEKHIEKQKSKIRKVFLSYFGPQVNPMAKLIMANRMVNILSNDELINIYESLDTSLKVNQFAQNLKNKINHFSMVQRGNSIPDIMLPDRFGKSFNLKSMRGKYVYIDFWASWCGPCRAEHPYLKNIYKRFKSKNFEIVGLSLDTSKTSWLNAIRKDGLLWQNVSDLKGFETSTIKQLGVIDIPDNLFIDPQGKVLFRNINKEILVKELKKLR